MLADMDPANDFVVAPPEPIADCEGKLRARWASTSAQARATGQGRQRQAADVRCPASGGVPARAGQDPLYNSAPIVSCGMALGLARFEQTLNQEAERYFGQGVARVEQGGTYNCRKMARFKLVSEHAYANAIDIRRP